MSTRPRARTLAEMNFFISLQPCPQCGERVDREPLHLYGDTDVWSVTGNCKRCGGPVAFPFRTHGDPLHAEHKHGQLGPGCSELITPGMFIAEIERLSPTVEPDPTKLGPVAWTVNRDTNGRVIVCLNELAKFLPPDSDVIPDDLLSRPEQYSRPWIEEMAARHLAVQAANIADLERIDRLERQMEPKRPTGGVDWLEREHLQAHESWVERGKTGEGRLLLVGAVHEEMRVGRGVELSGARFFDVSMPSVSLEDATMVGAELTNTVFEGGRFYGAELRDAKVNGGSFKGATLETAMLQGIAIDGTDFTEAELHFSEWKGAIVANATFERATFGDANLDGATFKACNFRHAVLSADDPDLPPTTRAVFEDCDLRDTTWEARDVSGAKFIRCKLAGISGTASAADAVEIVDADISAAEALGLWGCAPP